MGVRSWWDDSAVRQALFGVANATVQRAAEYMAQQARAYCPIDTGELQSSIIVIGDADGKRWYVQATAFYSTYVEYGHMTVTGTWVPPNPFMRKALADTAQQFPRIVQEVKGAHRFDSTQRHTIVQAGFGV